MSEFWFGKQKRLSYNYKGNKNASAFPKLFVQICKMDVPNLKNYLTQVLYSYYDATDISFGENYIYAKGTYPVCLTAHMDTVHTEGVKDFYGVKRSDGKHVITSPQGIGGDDRCGIYMILTILAEWERKELPSIIFCDKEEIGGVGSQEFTHTKAIEDMDVNFFIELDRANAKDLVFYDDENTEFHTWCEDITGYQTAFGSFSDISYLCPTAGISGVNISCGYYNAHTTDEYVVLEEMEESIEAAKKLIDAAAESKKFKYVDSLYGRNYWYSGESKGIGNYGSVTTIFYYQSSYEELQDVVEAESFYGCVAKFLMDHPDVCWYDVLDYEVM